MSPQITTLPNGLRIATDTMPMAESVVIGAGVGVGARHDPWPAGGIAHLTEHMMFKGTRNRSAFALSAAIEKKGGSMNAHTTREETAYYARVLPEEAPRALDVIADMLQGSLFDAKELERERQVVLQEISRDKDTPEDYVYELMHETAFPKQKIGRAILGTSRVIEAMPRDTLVDYVRRTYHAGTVVIVAVGKIEHQQVVEMARKAFAHLPAGAPVQAEAARIQAGDRREGKESEQLHVTLSFPAPGQKSRRAIAASVLGLLLGGSSTSRLFQKVREKRGLAYSVSATHLAFQDTGLFSVYAGTDPARGKELIPVICRELRDVTSHITRAELDCAKAQARADLLMGQESVMRRAEMLGTQMLTFGKPQDMRKTLAAVDALTADELQTLAGAILKRRPILTALGQTGDLESYASIRDRLAA